ncbi:MAG: hypothetical protein JW895_18305 [Thermoleophilaceae bacterium]|nr:hypothetical protein [Thermoleophilaceae bacterium]
MERVVAVDPAAAPRPVVRDDPARKINDYVSGIKLDLGAFATHDFSALNLEGSQVLGQCNLMLEPAPSGTHVVAVSTAGDFARAFVDGQPAGERGAGAREAVEKELPRLEGSLRTGALRTL